MRRAAALGLLVLAACAPGARAEGAPTGRLLVSLEASGDRARAAAPAVLARAAARRAGPAAPQIGLVTVRPAAGGDSLRAFAARLRRTPGVRAVDVERRARPRFVPADPALTDPETAPGTPTGTVVQWWASRMGLFEAWDAVRGSGTRIAVVDSGIDGEHPQFAGKVAAGIDADDTPGEGGPLVDEDGHGTHVASLACATSGDGIALAGAGLDCGLVVAKTDFSDASVARAIVDSVERGARVINLSFGTDGGRVAPTAIVDALRYAALNDVVLVAAAADQEVEEQGDPANLLQPTGTGPDLTAGLGLSVTAATFSDQRAAFAGRGTQISLAAYGAFERSAGPRGLLGAWPRQETTFDRGIPGPNGVPACRCRTTYRGDPRYAYLQGTSMATALVSAVAGLVREQNPDLRATEVVRLLKESARRPTAGWTPDLGWGITDARAAVAVARTRDRRAPASRLRAPARARGSVRLRWSGRDRGPRGVRVTGIGRYELWRSTSGRPAVRIARTRAISRRVRVRAGVRYGFFTVAVDRAGNRETAPAVPDARVRARG